MEFSIPIKKLKEQKVIELYTKNSSFRTIAKESKMSFRDISKIIKAYEAYEKKVELQKKKEENNQQSSTTKKLSLNSRIFKLFREGKQQTDCVIELDAHPAKVEKLWHLYLKAERMEDCYDFFQECQYDIPTLLLINNFLKMNNVDGHDILDILRQAKSIKNLQSNITNLQIEIHELQKTKNSYSLNYTNHHQRLLLPLGLPKYCYEQL